MLWNGGEIFVFWLASGICMVQNLLAISVWNDQAAAQFKLSDKALQLACLQYDGKEILV